MHAWISRQSCAFPYEKEFEDDNRDRAGKRHCKPDPQIEHLH